jgi:hypothetical protein
MLAHTIEEYKNAECVIARVDPLNTFTQVHSHLGGKLCDSGCGYFDKGRCGSYSLLTFDDPKPVVTVGRMRSGVITVPVKKVYTETVREEAARTGVSLSEVRRKRSEG